MSRYIGNVFLLFHRSAEVQPPTGVSRSMAHPPLVSASEFEGELDGANEHHLTAGRLRYYHYGVDGFRDHGWGCGYRTIQTMLSWYAPSTPPPTIPELQAILARGGTAIADTAWIGVPEAVVLLDELFGATAEVLPLASGSELPSHFARICNHFDGGGGPLMIGGGNDVYSKTVIGVRSRDGDVELLILDPHYDGPTASDVDALHAGGWACWRSSGVLMANSFYNLCLPRAIVSGATFVTQQPHGTSYAGTSGAHTHVFAAGATNCHNWGIEVVESSG